MQGCGGNFPGDQPSVYNLNEPEVIGRPIFSTCRRVPSGAGVEYGFHFPEGRKKQMSWEKHTWNQVPREELNPLLARQVVSGQRAMTVKIFLKKDCVVPQHSHESEQISYLLEGALRFCLEGPQAGEWREVEVRAGEVVVIPSNLAHSVLALEDSVALDVFSPIREDWLRGDDAYLRG
jgi:quercetin dioxygenase-like cupin family protein